MEKNLECSQDVCKSLIQIRSSFVDHQLLGIDRPISCYILPRTDSHQNEYLRSIDERVKIVSGFTGSNALAVITEHEALLWTDGRYFNQASEELLPGWKLMKMAVADSIDPIDWIVENVPAQSAVGFDPNIFSLVNARQLIKKLSTFNLDPVPISKCNLADLLQGENNLAEPGLVLCLNTQECGASSESKIALLREKISKAGCDALVVSQLDDIAWLLNIRGSDIPFNPVVFSYVVVTLIDVFLFIDEKKLPLEAKQHLSHVKIFPYEKVEKFLQKYHSDCKNKFPKKHKLWLPEMLSYSIGSKIEEQYSYVAPSPIQPLKAIKNEAELNGMRNSSVRDSAALIQFLAWLKREIGMGHPVDELKAEKQIDYYRSKVDGFISLSFHTISAVDEHAASPHYQATEITGTKLINQDSIYLVDSGGQYRDGTTDVTRTVCFNSNPDEYTKKMFTLVLIGHINLARTSFPEGISGVRLDTIAREPLWNLGYDFDHGVGHGVGHFLNVHEGPVGISYRNASAIQEGIKKGQILTIEPGYYEHGNFGIRIENCCEVVPAKNLEGESKTEKKFLTFSPLTLVPIQKNLIAKELLSAHHIKWLNDYHNLVLVVVGKYLQEAGMQEEYNFLAECCTPL